MINVIGKVVKVEYIEEEDLDFWRGLDFRGREIEYRSKRLHIKKELDEDGEITILNINGEEVYSREKFYATEAKAM